MAILATFLADAAHPTNAHYRQRDHPIESTMKKVEAFIKPFTLEAIKGAFASSGVETFRMLEAHELSSRQTHADVYRGTEYEMDVNPRVLIVAVVPDDEVDRVVMLVRDHCKTDHANDGWIVVSPVEEWIPIDEPEFEPR